MPALLDRDTVRRRLEGGDLRALFIEDLGWDHGGADVEATIAGRTFGLEAVAHKRGMVAYRHAADSEQAFPDHPTRQKIEKAVAKTVREHLIVYAAPDGDAQYWQWVKREPGRPDRTRTHVHHRNQPGEALIQKLEQLVFTLDEEEDLTIVDVSGRVRAAFDVEKVTKRFYDRFKAEHRTFLKFIEGVTNAADREWYASLMLNRMMFIYFIQKRGFLDGDPDYLRNRLDVVRRRGGGDFHRFYRLFLLRLFHEGLGQPEARRAPELAALLGRIPYLNGGLFDVHDLERDNPGIRVPDEAFERIFAFFDAWQWHLDDRPLRNDNEINPDVLGYIFEKYVNQKQMGAYYTREDITGYISRNTVIPFLFDSSEKGLRHRVQARRRGVAAAVGRPGPLLPRRGAPRHHLGRQRKAGSGREAPAAARDRRRRERRGAARGLEHARAARLRPAHRDVARARRPAAGITRTSAPSSPRARSRPSTTSSRTTWTSRSSPRT